MKKNNLFRETSRFLRHLLLRAGREQKGIFHGEQDKVYIVLEGEGTFQVGAEKRAGSRAGRRDRRR